ncbi:MAG: metallopeptidase TldD-related protein [archaeon]
MNIDNGILDKVNESIEYISKFGEGEIIYSVGNEISSQIVRNEINESIEKDGSNYTIRLFIDSKEGNFNLKKLNKEILDKIIKITKSNSKKEYFNGIPSKKLKGPKELTSKKLSRFNKEKILNYQKDLLKEIDDEVSFNSSFEYNQSKTYFLNTNGIEYKESDYSISSSFSSIYDQSGYSDYINTSNDITYNDFKSTALNSVNKAIQFSKADKLKKDPKTVTLLPGSFSSLVSNSYLSNLKAKNIEKKRSIYSKFKTKAIDNSLSIYDDPHIYGSTSSSNFDYEGIKCEPHDVLKNGFLTNPVADYNTAIENDLDYFGNYFSSTSFNNLIFDHDNMLSKDEYEKGDLLIDNVIGAHTSNSMTTEFSVNVHSAYYFDGNDFLPVNKFMISGKMKEMLDNSVGVVKYDKSLKSLYSNALKSNCSVTLD